MNSDYLRFAPDILRRLGEELIPHLDQGIIELVRNAYDADALHCTIEIIDTDDTGGTVRITDDGVGMTADDIRSGWLVIGRSSKAHRQRTKLGRLPVGDKGLGRLAALRLGSRALMVTRPRKEGGIEYKVELDWSMYDRAETVESVPLEIQESRTAHTCSGTIIEVNSLNVNLTRRDVQRLARSLVLLADPFEHANAFQPRLIAPAFEELSHLVSASYFDDAEYKLVARLDDDGRATAEVLDGNAQTLFRTEPGRLGKPPYRTGAAEFELWVFILDQASFSTRRASLSEVQEWLRVVGGVHLYHRGLRVHPYGDAGHDWLDMNLARSRRPEFRPSTNTSVGRVSVVDPREQLIQKTDRTGFVENEAFGELRRFAIDALEWMARERLRVGERRRQVQREYTSQQVSKATEDAKKAIDQLPDTVRPHIADAMAKFTLETERQTRTLREELQLYRTLATVGTTAALFAHESAQPLTRIERASRHIDKIANDATRSIDGRALSKLADLVTRSAHALQSFAGLPLKLLQRDKRRSGRVDVHRVIQGVLELFAPFLQDAHVEALLQFTPDEIPAVLGSVAAVESICANLLTNAVHALVYADPKPQPLRIAVRTEIADNRVALRFLDNGPGILDLDIDEIWLPGSTTKPAGTGLGLTIVKDSVSDLGGKVSAISPGELGGAEFVILLPLLGGAK
jgi:signal transduction histidine kinase